jgi:hypothetical protein
MENPQKIEFKSLDDLLCYLPQEELEIVLFFATLLNVCRTAKKLAYNVPFTIVILICYMASHNSLGNNSERCGYWFCKGDSFLMKLCNGKIGL